MGEGNFQGTGDVSNIQCGTPEIQIGAAGALDFQHFNSTKMSRIGSSAFYPRAHPQRVKANERVRVNSHVPFAADPLRVGITTPAMLCTPALNSRPEHPEKHRPPSSKHTRASGRLPFGISLELGCGCLELLIPDPQFLCP
jgi:hypothetical protein